MFCKDLSESKKILLLLLNFHAAVLKIQEIHLLI